MENFRSVTQQMDFPEFLQEYFYRIANVYYWHVPLISRNCSYTLSFSMLTMTVCYSKCSSDKKNPLISIYFKNSNCMVKREKCKDIMVLLHKSNRTTEVNFMGHCSNNCCLQ